MGFDSGLVTRSSRRGWRGGTRVLGRRRRGGRGNVMMGAHNRGRGGGKGVGMRPRPGHDEDRGPGKG